MNYLAHVLLARPTPEARLGALLGDFAQGLDPATLPAEAREALLEHRAIDAFVDGHPLLREQRARFAPALRRFAGILLDVFHDHFLVRHWERFAGEPLESVCASLYGALARHEHILPPRLRAIAPRLAAEDWLASYGELANVERALAGIARRMRRPTPIGTGAAELSARYGELEAGFLALYPEVRDFVLERRAAIAPAPPTPTRTRSRARP